MEMKATPVVFRHARAKTRTAGIQGLAPKFQPISECAHRKSMSPTFTPLNLTIPQAAAMLGVSRSHVYEIMERGELPWVQLGNERSHRRVRLVDLTAFNDSRLVVRPSAA